MKFSAATVLLFAAGISAMPWYSGNSQRNMGHADDEITVRLKVAQRGASHGTHVFAQDICWLACFSEEPKCPDSWYSSQQGECWTCCRSADDL